MSTDPSSGKVLYDAAHILPSGIGQPPDPCPLFETESYLPVFPDGRLGDWEVKTVPLIFDHGYHSGSWLVQNLQVLSRHGREDDAPATWMSLSPHEIESQELGCRNAFGHTVIMGLGMGWSAINTALNPVVEKVTVVELDPMVIELFNAARILENAPKIARDKIRIIWADACKWQPDGPVDFLCADIWRSLVEAGTLEQVRQMQANNRARKIYFWGQELLIYTLACRQWGALSLSDDTWVGRCVEEIIALPLLVPPDMNYAAMIKRIVRNRKARGLPLQR